MIYIIVDLDNCIADDSHRINRINWQHEDPFRRYHDYHLLSGFDKVGNRDLLEGISEIIIFTARPEHYRALTEEWLKRNNIEFAHLFMRTEGDHVHSRELKCGQLLSLSVHNVPLGSVVCAYDDRPDVVDMYKKFGIPAEVRAIHNLCAYTKPKENV